ncbi:unnamed protein product [Mesocestoides corti]|uniref:Uncharacterized protein n=1 Tax=Mesocestoides corti TaxID=53468 RepID=A0A0R3UQP9_MESCO|nr:unnamed protein product [Mesocestoides corti]
MEGRDSHTENLYSKVEPTTPLLPGVPLNTSHRNDNDYLQYPSASSITSHEIDTSREQLQQSMPLFSPGCHATPIGVRVSIKKYASGSSWVPPQALPQPLLYSSQSAGGCLVTGICGLRSHFTGWGVCVAMATVEAAAVATGGEGWEASDHACPPLTYFAVMETVRDLVH